MQEQSVHPTSSLPWILGAGVTGGCKVLNNVGAGTQTPVSGRALNQLSKVTTSLYYVLKFCVRVVYTYLYLCEYMHTCEAWKSEERTVCPCLSVSTIPLAGSLLELEACIFLTGLEASQPE